ncbi:MAG: dephospho-CoA kinase [Pirellulaceae bacterium]
MIVIGIVGGIASGKSVVTDRLKELGAVVLDADQIGHAVLRELTVKSAILQRWGNQVFTPDGEVDRGKVAAIVFDPQQPEQLKHLEEITHPLIAQRLQQAIDQMRQSGEHTMLVLDAPIMVKTGWHRLCDQLVFVDCEPEIRRERARARGWTSEMFESREARQAKVDEKRRLSTVMINNNGSLADTHRQVDQFWERCVTPQADQLPRQ